MTPLTAVGCGMVRLAKKLPEKRPVEPLTASAETELFNPEPRADHALPFHCAMWFAAPAPATEKIPPT
jgi:hypothetical protein